jgi:hypothetical protein
MFDAFLRAYEQGRAQAAAERCRRAEACFAPDASTRPAESQVDPHLELLEELVGQLPDDDAFHRGAERAQIVIAFAHGLKRYPLEERRAILQHAKSDLLSLGLTEDQIDEFDPSDAKLNRVIRQLRPLIDLHARQHPGHFAG